MTFVASAMQMAARMALPLATRGRLTILIFHRVLPAPDALLHDVWPAAVFEERMRWLRGAFNVLPLDQAVQRLRAGTLPARAAAITFDDGYRDNVEVAAPILARLGLTATFFIADGYLDGGRMFNDTVYETLRRLPAGEFELPVGEGGRVVLSNAASRRAAADRLLASLKYLPPPERLRVCEALAARLIEPLPDKLMMDSSQVPELERLGMSIGGHTVHHPILTSVSANEARAEIRNNKARLEALLGHPITLFAYPNGGPGRDYAAEHVAMVREAGYAAAVSTSFGTATATTDPFQLPRYTPWDLRPGRFEAGFVRNTLNPVATV
ncbi:MAG TPA: polysaccharide deacetylase family protein [Burkholderiaceae bacterium]|nr:polysaccharide deacetylase family protein [Burkholderiaceae bacterium]